MKVTLPRGLVAVCHLDDRVYNDERKITVSYKGSRHIVVEGDRDALDSLHFNCDDRSDPGNGWDQPAWYYRTARAAARILDEALNHDTEVRRRYGR